MFYPDSNENSPKKDLSTILFEKAQEEKLLWSKGLAEARFILSELEEEQLVSYGSFVAEVASRSGYDKVNLLIGYLRSNNELIHRLGLGIKRGPNLIVPDLNLLTPFQRSWTPENPVPFYRNGSKVPSNEGRDSRTLSVIHHHLDEGSKIIVQKSDGTQEELVFTVEKQNDL